MALRKPSDIFNKEEISGVFNSPEISSDITESYNRFRDNFNSVNNLSEKVEQLSQQLSEKIDKSDLENAMLSQLMVLDENFKSIQNQIKGLNKEDLKEFKISASNLTEIVKELVENTLPKYKKQIISSEILIGEKFDTFKDNIEENILNIRDDVDTQVSSIVEVIDNNLEYFNNQLQETSSEVKKTTDTYNKLSKIIENKVFKESEKLEEYSQVIQSLYETFTELEESLQKETSTYLQVIDEKFKTISSDVNGRIYNINEEVGNIKDKVSFEIANIKSDVVINEQHIKNVDKYLKENHQELVTLREEVFLEIEQIPVGNFQENLDRLEKKIDFIKETYSKIEPEVVVKEVIQEGLLNISPEEKTPDPLTPLNQNFVTLDQLQEHYRLFINRIQQQLSTLGGGGETQLKYLDDIVGIATNASAYDGKYLKYNHSLLKFEFTDVGISNVKKILNNYTLLRDDEYILADGNFTIQLPTSIGYCGDKYFVKNVGIGTITIIPFENEKIDGNSTLIITEQYSSLSLLSDGSTGWFIF